MILTFATIAAVVAISGSIAYAIDPYGLLRNPEGRKLIVWFSDRRAKVLMSRRYVPTNFDGLLLGPSSCELWNLSTIDGAKMFNECVGGEDAVEARILVNQALARGHFKLAVFLLDITMTSTHEVRDQMDSTGSSQAIWSIHGIVNELLFVLHQTHVRLKYDNAPNGQMQFFVKTDYSTPLIDPASYQLDPIALKAFQDAVLALRNNGATIVYVVPPLYGPYFQANQTGLQEFIKVLRSKLPPAPVVDLNESKYDDLRFDRRNFRDRVHTSPAGSSRVATLLEKLIPDAVVEQRQPEAGVQGPGTK